MGCSVLEFGGRQVGAYGRGFEDVEGVKVDLLMWDQIINFFLFFLVFVFVFVFVLEGEGGESTYLRKPTSQKRANEKLESLQLGLNDNQSKIRLGICIPRLRLHQINLLPL